MSWGWGWLSGSEHLPLCRGSAFGSQNPPWWLTTTCSFSARGSLLASGSLSSSLTLLDAQRGRPVSALSACELASKQSPAWRSPSSQGCGGWRLFTHCLWEWNLNSHNANPCAYPSGSWKSSCLNIHLTNLEILKGYFILPQRYVESI